MVYDHRVCTRVGDDSQSTHSTRVRACVYTSSHTHGEPLEAGPTGCLPEGGLGGWEPRDW